jgi:hypothetical protein
MDLATSMSKTIYLAYARIKENKRKRHHIFTLFILQQKKYKELLVFQENEGKGKSKT